MLREIAKSLKLEIAKYGKLQLIFEFFRYLRSLNTTQLFSTNSLQSPEPIELS